MVVFGGGGGGGVGVGVGGVGGGGGGGVGGGDGGDGVEKQPTTHQRIIAFWKERKRKELEQRMFE